MSRSITALWNGIDNGSCVLSQFYLKPVSCLLKLTSLLHSVVCLQDWTAFNEIFLAIEETQSVSIASMTVYGHLSRVILLNRQSGLWGIKDMICHFLFKSVISTPQRWFRRWAKSVKSIKKYGKSCYTFAHLRIGNYKAKYFICHPLLRS